MQNLKDEIWMREALAEARKAFEAGEVPVGAVAVFEEKILARAHNEVETRQDATAHAEVLCLQRAAAALGNWRQGGVRLYCTLEPCTMCAGAMMLSRIDTLIWAAPDLRHGAHGSWLNVLDTHHPIHQLSIRTHVLAEEAASLMKAFFKERRESCGRAL